MKNPIRIQGLIDCNTTVEHTLIADTIRSQGYDEQLSIFLCSMLNYMQNEHWRGSCHAACSIMYVALSELGYRARLCIGEVKVETFYFDHSWILLDGKVIDLAVATILVGGHSISGPIILDTDIRIAKKHLLQYGVYKSGLDAETIAVKDMRFIEYMDRYPKLKSGLWGVLEAVFPKKTDISILREKYKDVRREYIYDFDY